MSLSYFFYFAILGAIIPYMARYLRSQDFGFAEISQTAAVLTLSMAAGPFLWASLSDRSGKRMLWVRVSAFMMLVSAVLLGLSTQPFWLVLFIGVFGLFLSSAIPQLEAVTLEYLGPGSTRYGNIRLWGTLGFAVIVLALGPALELTGASVLPWWLAGMTLVALASFAFLRDVPYTSEAPRSQARWSAFLARLRQTPVWCLYLALFLWNVSLAAYNTFFDLYLQEMGYSGAAIGGYLAMAPIAEVFLFIVLSRLLTRWGPVTVLVVALAATAIRWLMTAWVADVWWLLMVAQSGHALTYGAMHGTSMYLLSRLFPANQQARAQALYLAFSTSLGLVLGNLVAGELWSLPAGPQWVFSLNAVLCVAAIILIVVALRGERIRRILSH